jgi:hypothetical protein
MVETVVSDAVARFQKGGQRRVQLNRVARGCCHYSNFSRDAFARVVESENQRPADQLPE